MDDMITSASLFQSIAFAAIVICCLAGIILQFFAWRHLKPGIPRLGHKDALFKKKDLYYTEAGMKYVELQKLAMYIMTALFIVLLFTADLPEDTSAEGTPDDGQETLLDLLLGTQQVIPPSNPGAPAPPPE